MNHDFLKKVRSDEKQKLPSDNITMTQPFCCTDCSTICINMKYYELKCV